MRRSFLITLFVLLSVLAFSEINLKDVSPLIPEYEAVIYLVSHGVMDAPDGYFKGGKIVTKFDLAVYLYNMIKFTRNLEPIPEASSLGVIQKPPVEETLQLLEYNPETGESDRLRRIEKRLTALEDLISSISKTPAVPQASPVRLEEKEGEREYESLTEVLNEYEKRVSNLEMKIPTLEERVNKVEGDLGILETYTASLVWLKKKTTENESNIKGLMNDLYKFAERTREIEKTLGVIKTQVEILKGSGTYARLSEVESVIRKMRKELTDLKDLIGDYEGMYRKDEKEWMVMYSDKIKNLESRMENFEATSSSSLKDLADQVEGLKADVKRLNDMLSAVKVSQKIAEDVQGMATVMEIMTVISAVSALVSLGVAIYLSFFK